MAKHVPGTIVASAWCTGQTVVLKRLEKSKNLLQLFAGFPAKYSKNVSEAKPVILQSI